MTIKNIWLSQISLLFALVVGSAEAATLNPAQVNGVYQLMQPERGAKKVTMQLTSMGGKPVMAVAVCKGCAPAVYQFLKEQSHTLQKPVFFNSMGLYLIGYDDNSYAVIMADGELGRKIWKKVSYANLYSKDASKIKSMSPQKLSDWAIDLSSQIMNQDVGEMRHQSGTYYLAVPQNHLGKRQLSYQIAVSKADKPELVIQPCPKCNPDRYQYLAEESAILDSGVYRKGRSNYLFDLADGVYVHAFINGGGLGQQEWGSHNHYNVFASNQAYIRQLLTSKEKQGAIDSMLKEYFAKVKKEFERRARLKQQAADAKRDLPAEGLNDKSLAENALAAAKRWANAWQWKETLNGVRITDHDWRIIHHRLTGLTVARQISGVVTMHHPDGRCRFQWATFREDYDGSKYSNLRMIGVGPVYNLSCDKL